MRTIAHDRCARITPGRGHAATTGLVLAGGRSRRMGTDKAVLVVDGRRLVDRAVANLQACCMQVVVASGNGQRLGGLDVPQVPDAVPGQGPLGGVLAGLDRAAHPLVAVLAVDLPDADPAVFRLLAGQWAGEAVIAPRVGGRVQPLHAVWARAAAPHLRDLLQEGVRSVTAAAERLGMSVVDLGDASFTRNLNRVEDL